MSDQIRKLNDAVYRIERWVVVASLLAMALAVFVDVVHRGFAGEASKFAEIGTKLAGMVGSLPEKDAPQYADEAAALSARLAAVSPYVLSTTCVALLYFGIRSAKLARPVPPPKAAAFAVVGMVAVWVAIGILLRLAPNGLVWSQPMALVLTLWVGFVGASMCTYERKHLKVEAVQRLVPDRYKPLVGFVSGLATTVICLCLLWLSLRYVLYNYNESIATAGRGATFEGWDVAKWKGFAVLPIAFGIMGARFFGRAVATLQGTAVVADTIMPGESEDDSLPSNVETEAVEVVDAGGSDAASEEGPS